MSFTAYSGAGWASLGADSSWAAAANTRDVVDTEAEMASWFVSGMPRSEVREMALKLIAEDPPGSFLVRDVQSEPDCFGLSVKTPEAGLVNYLIERVNDKRAKMRVRGYRLRGTADVFQTLSTLITFYAEQYQPALGVQLVLKDDDYLDLGGSSRRPSEPAQDPARRRGLSYRREGDDTSSNGGAPSETSGDDAGDDDGASSVWGANSTSASSVRFEHGRDGPPRVSPLDPSTVADVERWATNKKLEETAYHKSIGRSALKASPRKGLDMADDDDKGEEEGTGRSGKSKGKTKGKSRKKAKKSKGRDPDRQRSKKRRGSEERSRRGSDNTNGNPGGERQRRSTGYDYGMVGGALDLAALSEDDRQSALHHQLELYRKESELAQERLRAAERTMQIMAAQQQQGGGRGLGSAPSPASAAGASGPYAAASSSASLDAAVAASAQAKSSQVEAQTETDRFDAEFHRRAAQIERDDADQRRAQALKERQAAKERAALYTAATLSRVSPTPAPADAAPPRRRVGFQSEPEIVPDTVPASPLTADLADEEERYMQQARALASGAAFNESTTAARGSPAVVKKTRFAPQVEQTEARSRPAGSMAPTSKLSEGLDYRALPSFVPEEILNQHRAAGESSAAARLRNERSREEEARQRLDEKRQLHEAQQQKWREHQATKKFERKMSEASMQSSDGASSVQGSQLSLNSLGSATGGGAARPLRSALRAGPPKAGGKRKKKKVGFKGSSDDLARNVSFAEGAPRIDIRIDVKAQEEELDKLKQMEAREKARRERFDQERHKGMQGLKGLTWKRRRRTSEQLEKLEREEMERRRRWDVRHEEREAKFLMNRPEASEQLEEYIRELEEQKREEMERRKRKDEETLGLVGEGKVGRLLQMFSGQD